MSKLYEVVCSSSDHKRWLEERRNSIGASDVLNNVTLQDKLGNKKPYTNKWAFNGTMLEPTIIRMFSIWTGMRCRPHGSLLRSVQYPFMGATLDGLCKMPRLDRGIEKMRRYLTMDMGVDELTAESMLRDTKLAGLEIKAPVYRKLSEWGKTEKKEYNKKEPPYLKFLGIHDKVPLQYYTQVQHQMIVTGLKVVWLVALVGGEELIAYRIEANQKAQEKRLELCEDFWQKVEKARNGR